jgi:hypothetical protein
MNINDPKFDRAKAFIVPNIFAFVVIGITRFFIAKYAIHEPFMLITSEFVIIPILMGIISAWYMKNIKMGSRAWAADAMYISLIAVFLSYFFLNEGFICLIIVAPLIFGFIGLGRYLGKKMFEKNNNTLNTTVLIALLFAFITDSLSEHHYQNMVSDKLVINATPDKVWKNVVSFKKIEQKNNYWLFQIGMPSPMETTVTGNYKGAGRKCIFSNGYVFGETIVTYDENKNLTFDIIDQPKDPEIMGHIDILRGQFLLQDNHDGTTTLIGNSWYNLYVFPTWYYDIWARSITRNVHFRVMEHIKQLSEKS